MPYSRASVANHHHGVTDASGTCGFNCSTTIVRYAAPSVPASSEFVSMRRNRMAQVYTSPMLVDVDAAVIANTRLSEDYSVLALAAPEIAAAARPGQFVMLKTSRGMDPLLRRPFSIFEILRDADGAPRGITILNKRIGKGTGLLYEVEAGARIECLGPLGRPFAPVAPPAQAWMVAGGVGLAPFVTLAEAFSRTGTPTTLFYGARRAADLHCAEVFEQM